MLFGLDRLKPGCEAMVIHIGTQRALQLRLRDLGFVPGTKVQCSYRGPGNRVTALKFRGCVIALRTRDLSDILVRANG